MGIYTKQMIADYCALDTETTGLPAYQLDLWNEEE
jgi:hypothetical protein